MRTAGRLVNMWTRGEALPEGAHVLRANFKTTWAMARTGMVAHVPDYSLLVVDGDKSVMFTRWRCGSTTYDALPLPELDDTRECAICLEALNWPSGPVVYRCYDALDRLIYIGSSVNLATRVVGHRYGTPWWPNVARLDVTGYPNEFSARRAEAAAITAEEPVHNRRGLIRRMTQSAASPTSPEG